jgi:hypothetical protein
MSFYYFAHVQDGIVEQREDPTNSFGYKHVFSNVETKTHNKIVTQTYVKGKDAPALKLSTRP